MYVEIEDTPYAGLIQHHIRIGDTFCFVPPTSIQVSHSMKNNKAYLLRSRHPQIEESGFVERKITISLFFANLDAINNELRPLISQMRKLPFLPIESVYLNEVHNITAVAITSMAMNNVDGFPNCLQMELECAPFNDVAVFNDPLGRRYDQMIDWEKFRWYYKRSLENEYRYAMITHYEMLHSELDNDFTFYMADELSLEGIREWRKQKLQIIYGREKDKNERTKSTIRSLTSESKEYQDFLEKYQEHASGVIKYEEINYIPYDFPSLLLTGFSYSINNNITSIPMQMLEDPIHQFLGAQDMKVVLEFQTTDMDAVAHMNAMMAKNQYMLREFHAEMPYGMLKLETQMTKLLGAEYLAVEDVQFVASNEHTGIYTVQVVGTIFKKIDRKATEMQWINAPDSPFNAKQSDGSSTFDWSIDRYADQSFLGRVIPDGVQAMDNWTEGLGGNMYEHDFKAVDDTIFEPIANITEFQFNQNILNRNWFGFGDSPIGERMKKSLDTVFKGYTDIDSFDQKKQREHEHHLKETMGMYEIYPDLELPTWAEFSAHFGVEAPANAGVFLDPDFFIDYADNSLYVSDVIKSLMEDANQYSEEASNSAGRHLNVLQDPFGGTATYDVGNQSFGEVTGYDDDFKDLEERAKQIDKTAKDYAAEQAKEKEQAASDDSVTIKPEDKVNMPAEDAEAYIRKAAEADPNVTQAYAVAFAKTDNKELQQYFKKGNNAGLGHKSTTQEGLVVGFKNKETSEKTSLTVIGSSADTKADAGKASHIGIMKVPTANGMNTPSTAIYLPSANITHGVTALGNSVKAVMKQVGTSNKKVVLERVRKYFADEHNYDYKNDSQVKFALATLYHLGEETAVSVIIAGNKPDKISKAAVEFAHKVNNEMIGNSKDLWKAEDLKAKTANIKIPDIVVAEEEKNEKVPDDPEKIIGTDIQKMNIQNTGFADMIEHDKRGRLIRCFPTMMGMFIDEGRYIKSVKLADNFFNYQAFESITYVNNRKDASSTCYIELNNINQNLTDASKNVDTQESSLWPFLRSFMGAGEMAYAEQRSRDNETYDTMKSVSLTTGTRFHLRMGYGADARFLPTIMNGTITSIQNDGPRMTLIIQDDGIELSGKLKAKPSDASNYGWFSAKDEPTEIIDYLLGDEGGFWHNTKRRFSSDAYRQHSAGIAHFGLNDVDIPLERLKSGLWGGIKGMVAGAGTGAALGAWFGGIGALPGAAIGLITGGIGSFFAHRNLNSRPVTELNMNIHPHNGMSKDEVQGQGWFESMTQLFGFSLAGNEEMNVNISFFDKSMWDILNICAAIDQDHIVAVHPFDFRSTIFSGRPNYPIKVGYNFDVAKAENLGADADDMAEILSTEERQFRQLRMYDSYSSISSNTMMCSEKNMYNCATPVYLNEGELVSAPTLYVDKNIYTDRQKHVNIDTAINAKGVWAVDAIPLVGGMLNKPAEWLFDEGVAVRIAASGLRDFMKDMYDGYITVIGDPSTKPFDMAWIDDDYLKMKGPVEIKEVVHIMDYESGFITLIKPDLVVITRDVKQAMTPIFMFTSAASAVSLGYLTRKMLARKLKMSPKSSLAHIMWALSKGGFNMNKKLAVGTFNLGNTIIDKVTGRKVSPEERKEKYKARQEKYTADAMIKAFKSDEGLVKKYWNMSRDDVRTLASGLRGNYKTINAAAKVLRIETNPDAPKKIGKIADSVKKLRAVATLTPWGMLAKALEAAVFVAGGAMVREVVMRQSFYDNACMIIPIRKQGTPWTAGMQGAGSSVFGRPERSTLKQRFLRNTIIDNVSKFLLGVSTKEASSPFVGFEGIADFVYENSKEMEEDDDLRHLREHGIAYYRHILPLVEKSVKAELAQGGVITKEKMDVWVADASVDHALANVYPDPTAIEQSIDYNVELYKERQMRVYDIIEERINKRITKKKTELEDIETEKDGMNILERIKSSVSSLFSKLFGLLGGLFGGDKSGSNCSAEGVTLNGKFKVSGVSATWFEYLSPIIEKEAKAQGASQYTELLKAITMQESSGNYKKTPDVMQSSESINGQMGVLKGVEASVKQGIKHFLTCIDKAKGDLKIAIQCYNFGTGFASYAIERGGYSKETAATFSEMWRKRKGWKRYGDKDYVDHVLRYYEGDLGSVNCEGSDVNGDIGYATKCPNLKKGASHDANADANKINASRANGYKGLVALNAKTLPKNVKLRSCEHPYLRAGAIKALKRVATEWEKVMPGDTLHINSAMRPGDTYYHGTGWSIDFDDIQNCVRKGGQYYGPNKQVSDRNEKLIKVLIKNGWRSIFFDDYSFVPRLQKQYPASDGYGGWYIKMDPRRNHWNHIHASYPICE